LEGGEKERGGEEREGRREERGMRRRGNMVLVKMSFSSERSRLLCQHRVYMDNNYL
jgi:hypothetical protein